MSPNAFQRRQQASARLPEEPVSPPTVQQAAGSKDQDAPSPETAIPGSRVAGSGRASSINDPESQAPPRDAGGDLCRFAFSDGRHCRMPRWDNHDLYCLHHARDEQPLLGADQVAQELVSLSGDFKTASDVNHVLGKLFSLRVKNLISRRDAATLTYMAQLMLQSLPGVRREIISYSSIAGWESTLESVFAANAAESDSSDSQNENRVENGA